MRRAIAVIAAVASSLLCGPIPIARAAHPLVTEDTGTQDPGKQQLELNTDWLHKAGSVDRIGSLTYTYGWRDDLDLFGTVPFTLSSQGGMNDVSLGMKWKVLEGGRSSVALKPELFLPSGDEYRSLGTGYPAIALTLATSTDVAPWIFHTNIALSLNHYRMPADRAANRNALWRASGAVEYSLTEKCQLVADIGVARAQENDSDAHPIYALAGLIYSPQKDIDLDAGIRFNRNCNSCAALGRRQFGVGLTWRF